MKTFVTVDKVAFVVSDVTVYIPQAESNMFGGVYRHPSIVIKLQPKSRPRHEWSEYNHVSVRFEMQQHEYREGDDDPNRRPRRLDTNDRRWVPCYAAKITDAELREFRLDNGTKRSPDDRIRLAVLRKLTKTIDKYNLRLAYDCEMDRITAALTTIDSQIVVCNWICGTEHGGNMCDVKPGAWTRAA